MKQLAYIWRFVLHEKKYAFKLEWNSGHWGVFTISLEAEGIEMNQQISRFMSHSFCSLWGKANWGERQAIVYTFKLLFSVSLLFDHLGVKIAYDAILLFAENDTHLVVSDS